MNSFTVCGLVDSVTPSATFRTGWLSYDTIVGFKFAGLGLPNPCTTNQNDYA